MNITEIKGTMEFCRGCGLNRLCLEEHGSLRCLTCSSLRLNCKQYVITYRMGAYVLLRFDALSNLIVIRKAETVEELIPVVSGDAELIVHRYTANT